MKKIVVFVILGWMLSTHLVAQNTLPPTIDSLYKEIIKMPDDGEKFNELELLAMRLLDMNVDSALAMHEKAGELLKKLNSPQKEILALNFLAIIQMVAGDLQTAEENMKKVVDYILYKDTTMMEHLGKVYNNLGRICKNTERLEEAIDYRKKAIKLTKDRATRIDIEFGLGVLYCEMALLDESLEIFLPNIKELEARKDDLYAVDQLISFYVSTAGVYSMRIEHDIAEDYCRKAIPLAIQLKKPKALSFAYLNLGVALMELGHLDSSLVYFNKATDLRRAAQTPFETITCLFNLELIHTKLEQYDKGLEVVEEAWGIQKNLNYKPLEYAVLLSLARVVLAAQEAGWNDSKFNPLLGKMGLSSVNDLFLRLEPDKYGIETKATRLKGFTRLKDYYKSQGQMDKAYIYQDSFIRTAETIFNLEKEKVAANLTFKYDVEKKEKLLALQQKDLAVLERDNAQKRVSLLGLGFLATLLGLVVLFVNNRRIKTKKEKQLLEKEQKLAKVQLQNTELLLDQKKQALVKYADILKTKNEVIEQLEGEVQNLGDQQQENQQEKIQKLYEQTILTEEDWTNFKQLFSEVHSNFLKQLQAQFPALTQAEVRMFMLIKLDFSTQHIAGVLGISADSVHKTKYRLRKRLGLESNKDLAGFVRNFGEQESTAMQVA